LYPAKALILERPPCDRFFCDRFFAVLYATAREFDVAGKAACVFFGGGAIGAMIKAMCDDWEDLDRQVNERI